MSLNKKEKMYLDILRKSLGVISSACKSANVCRRWHYQRIEKNPAFKEEVENIMEETIDFVESKLYSNINNGMETSIIFYLKTKAKNRGYVERVENDVTISPFLELMKSVGAEDKE